MATVSKSLSAGYIIDEIEHSKIIIVGTRGKSF